MEPTLLKNQTKCGVRVHCNFLENAFLTQNVDLGLEFNVPIFETPINDHFLLPAGSVKAPVFDYQKNTEIANLLAGCLEA